MYIKLVILRKKLTKIVIFFFRFQTSKQVEDITKIERIMIINDGYEFDFDLSETVSYFGLKVTTRSGACGSIW